MTDALDIGAIEARFLLGSKSQRRNDAVALLAEVKRLRARVADAWEDGHDAGIDHAHQIYTDNPYRTQPEGDRLTTP